MTKTTTQKLEKIETFLFDFYLNVDLAIKSDQTGMKKAILTEIIERVENTNIYRVKGYIPVPENHKKYSVIGYIIIDDLRNANQVKWDCLQVGLIINIETHLDYKIVNREVETENADYGNGEIYKKGETVLTLQRCDKNGKVILDTPFVISLNKFFRKISISTSNSKAVINASNNQKNGEGRKSNNHLLHNQGTKTT